MKDWKTEFSIFEIKNSKNVSDRQTVRILISYSFRQIGPAWALDLHKVQGTTGFSPLDGTPKIH